MYKHYIKIQQTSFAGSHVNIWIDVCSGTVCLHIVSTQMCWHISSMANTTSGAGVDATFSSTNTTGGDVAALTSPTRTGMKNFCSRYKRNSITQHQKPIKTIAKHLITNFRACSSSSSSGSSNSNTSTSSSTKKLSSDV